MLTLTFLVCYTMTGQCVGVSPQHTFVSPIQCEMFARALMIENKAKADEGAMAPHVARHLCVNWGVDS